jgi:hypothetical protein
MKQHTTKRDRDLNHEAKDANDAITQARQAVRTTRNNSLFFLASFG